MQTSEVENAQRDDDSLTVEGLISTYAQGAEDLRTAVAGMTGEQLLKRPFAGKWSTLEVVCHIADTEQFFADRMKRTAAMDHPLLIGVDGFIYPEKLGYQQHDLEEELDLVAVTRDRSGVWALAKRCMASLLVGRHPDVTSQSLSSTRYNPLHLLPAADGTIPSLTKYRAGQDCQAGHRKGASHEIAKHCHRVGNRYGDRSVDHCRGVTLGCRHRTGGSGRQTEHRATGA
jgi:hypothetical protein